MEQKSRIFKGMDIMPVSKKLIRLTSAETAIVYGALISLRAESLAAGESVTIDEKVFFHALQEEIVLETGLTIRRIRPAIAKLIEIGALEKKENRLPNITLYHIVPDRLFEFYEMKGGDL